jgi:hypothetical protein
VYVATAVGQQPRRITAEASDIPGLAWVPGKPEIVFSTDRSLWETDLERLPISGPSGSLPTAIPGTARARHPALVRSSADARIRLAYERDTQERKLYSLDLPSPSNERREASPLRPIAVSTRDEIDPSFSFDGRSIAFASARSAKFPQIWVGDRDGSNLQQRTNLPCSAGSPAWSPDGETVAFDCGGRMSADIYTVPASGGPPHRLTSESSAEYVPSWSSDGRWIYFTSDRVGGFQIWKMPAGGGLAVQITKGGAFRAVESPDGKLLYFTRRDQHGLWAMEVGGGIEKRILPSAEWYGWSVANAAIYFAAEEPNLHSPALFYYPFDTHEATRAAVLSRWPGPLAVSRDGSRAIFTYTDNPGSDIEMIDGFR